MGDALNDGDIFRYKDSYYVHFAPDKAYAENSSREMDPTIYHVNGHEVVYIYPEMGCIQCGASIDIGDAISGPAHGMVKLYSLGWFQVDAPDCNRNVFGRQWTTDE